MATAIRVLRSTTGRPGVKASPSGLVYHIVRCATAGTEFIPPQPIFIYNRAIQVQRVIFALRELPQDGLDPLARLGCRRAMIMRAGHVVQLLAQPLGRRASHIPHMAREKGI